MNNRTITRTAKAIPLGTRSILAVSLASVVGLIAFLWPFLAAPESAVLAHATDAPFFFALLVPLVLVVVLAQFADGGFVVDLDGVVLHPVGIDVDQVEAVEATRGEGPVLVVVCASERRAPAAFADVNRAVR